MRAGHIGGRNCRESVCREGGHFLSRCPHVMHLSVYVAAPPACVDRRRNVNLELLASSRALAPEDIVEQSRLTVDDVSRQERGCWSSGLSCPASYNVKQDSSAPPSMPVACLLTYPVMHPQILPGTCVHVSAGQSHRLKNTGDEDMVLLYFGVATEPATDGGGAGRAKGKRDGGGGNALHAINS